MIIYIASDHRGFKLKESLKDFLKALGYETVDLGNGEYDKDDDYPDFASKVAKSVVNGADAGARGIVICGSGAGVNIVANKFKGVRSVLAASPEQAAAGRRDADANVLALAADFLTPDAAQKIAKAWLDAPSPVEERHKRRLEKIKAIENGLL